MSKHDFDCGCSIENEIVEGKPMSDKGNESAKVTKITLCYYDSSNMNAVSELNRKRYRVKKVKDSVRKRSRRY